MDSAGSPSGRRERAPTTDTPPDSTTRPPPADDREASTGQTTQHLTEVEPDPGTVGAISAGTPRARQRRASRRADATRGTASTSKSRRTNRSDRTEQAIREHIARLVANAPPLSPETRARLAELFSVTHRNRARP